jgi:hypothetical protein
MGASSIKGDAEKENALRISLCVINSNSPRAVGYYLNQNRSERTFTVNSRRSSEHTHNP